MRLQPMHQNNLYDMYKAAVAAHLYQHGELRTVPAVNVSMAYRMLLSTGVESLM